MLYYEKISESKNQWYTRYSNSARKYSEDHGPQLPTDGKEPYLNACLPSLLSSRAPFLEVGKFLNRQLLQDYSSLLIYNSILRMKQEGH